MYARHLRVPLFFVASLRAQRRALGLLGLLAALLLAGCAGGPSPISETFSAVMAQRFGAGAQAATPAPTDPRYRYLRVQAPERNPALLVLGYVDAHPLGDIEVWYSADREVIQTQNGRIVATAGLLADWSAVRFDAPPPAWTDVPAAGAHYLRTHDQMPGYRFGIAQRLQLTPWPGVPAVPLPATLTPAQARGYQWFREAALPPAVDALPPAWFAWGMHRGRAAVVYSAQCLTPTLCLTLQRWPVQEE